MYYIYVITNLINGKVYIGFTENPKRRWNAHRQKSQNSCYRLYKALQKYGSKNFTFDVIYEHSDKDRVLDREVFFIKEYDSIKNGYNVSPGGGIPSEYNRLVNKNRLTDHNPMKILRKNGGTFKKGQKPIITPERNEKIRQGKLREKNPQFGNPEASAHLNSNRVSCEICKKDMNIGNYIRWHSSGKCRLKRQNQRQHT